MSDLVKGFIFELQLREGGMPPSYPHTGLFRLYEIGEQVARNALVDTVARAI